MRNIRENIIENISLRKEDFLEKRLIAQIRKRVASVGHVVKLVIMLMSVKNRKNNKLAKALGSLDYIEIS